MSTAIDIAPAKRHLPIITNSAAKTFRRCAREYQNSYVERVRSVRVSDALRFGTLIHLALEAWWKTANLERALAALDVESDPYERAKAEALIIGYDMRWCDEQYDVLAVECEFTAPLINPDTGRASTAWSRGGKIDAIARRNGLDVVIEHKTTSEDIGLGSDYWKRLTLDTQISGYLVGARALGYEPQGVVYDVIRKPALRPLMATPVEAQKRKADGSLYANQREESEMPTQYRNRILADIGERPSWYYQRCEIVRLAIDEHEAAVDLWQLAGQIRESTRRGVFPRNPDACVRYGRTCDYFGVCTRTESLDDESKFRRADTAHEELSL